MSSVRNKGTSSRKKTSGASGFTSSATTSSSNPRGASDFMSSNKSRGASDFISSTKSSKSNTTSSSARSDRSGGASSSRSRDSVSRSRSGENLTSSSKLPPQESLMEIVQKRFVSDVFESAAKAHAGWKILIVDEPGMKVISAAVGMYDIMERQISIVESLEKKRAPFKDMDAVYILAPTQNSVSMLLEDYEDKSKVLYGKSVFVYFLGPIPNNLISQIKGCKQLIKRLKALSEINVDFLVRENRAFTLDTNANLKAIYDGRMGMNSVEMQLAEKLVTVCATLNEYPYIRFAQSSPVCSSLASIFKLKMDDFVGANPSWWYHGSGKCPVRNGERERSTFLLLDRASDCLTPLMHDFRYQAMVHDLLTIEGDKITYKAEKVDNPSQKEDKDVLLNDKDKIWVEMRGNHIADVIQVLSERINEVVSSSTSGAVHKGSKEMKISELAAALKELPEYREVMSKLSQHLHIATDCMGEFRRQDLLALAEIEQTLVNGKDEDGKSISLDESIENCTRKLERFQDPIDKLRLIAIAIISQNGLSHAHYNRLIGAASFRNNEAMALESLRRLGVQIHSNGYSTPSSATNSFFGSVKSRLTNSSSFDSVDEEDAKYEGMRYTAPLKSILSDLVTNQLSQEDYPSVIPMPMSAGSTSVSGSARRRGKGTESSLRKKGGATDKWSKMGNSVTSSTGGSMYTGGRNMVFMVGGLSFPELRVARSVMERESREIIIGSTKFLSPADFLNELKDF